MLSRAGRSPARDDVVQCKDDALRNMYEFLHAQLNYAIMHVEMRKYSNKGVGVMAAAGEVTRLSPTPIQRSIIILKGLSMSIDENNNYDDGNGDD